MIDNFLEKYIQELYQKSNIGVSNEQRNLYTEADYYRLLKPVVEVIKENRDCTIQELRSKLYERSNIENLVKDFIFKKEMAPGLVFTYGTKNFQEVVIIGNKQEVELDGNEKIVPKVREMTEDTIFDLASITKLFTSLATLKLIEMGQINLNTKIVDICPQFKNLKDVTVYNLLSFNVPLRTKTRIDNATSKEEAEKILFDIEINKEDNGMRPYTDMGAMVLKYVIEKVSGMSYYSFLNKEILSKIGLHDTHVNIPKYKLDRLASTNLDAKIVTDGSFSVTKFEHGNVYDPKARVMGQIDGNLSGHAGLFSTAEDMKKLAKSMIDGNVIDEKFIKMMAKNRTGKPYINEDGKKCYIQYLGFLCYSKNPIANDTELFHAMSGRSIASAGWTGTQFTVDPLNELYFFLGSNRSHNRITFIANNQKDRIIEDENGKKTVKLPNGNIMIDSSRFAWERTDVIVDPALKLALQYKMLEDIFEYSKEQDKTEKNVRKIS